MSTAVKEKKPFLPQRKVSVQPGGGAVALRSTVGGRSDTAVAPLKIGGEPRVHLLPVEVGERQKLKALKRRLLFMGILVVAVVLIGYVLATVSLTAVQSQLTAAQNTTQQLIAQQGQYSAVTKVNNDITAIQQSQKSATAQEILWAPYLLMIENTLPSGASIGNFSGTIDTPLGTPASASTTVPLQGPRIATVQMTILMNQADVPAWLVSLQKLKGYVDATPNSVSASGDPAGPYTVSVTLHVSDAAISNRFTKAAEATK